MPRHSGALLTLAGVILFWSTPRVLPAQGSFRTSLTVTISRLAPEGKPIASDSLACRQLSLHWRELAGAQRYVVYVSTNVNGPWVELPQSNACGPREASGPTSVTAAEPTAASSGTRKVYYKVVAMGGGAATERTLDTTEVVSVELR
ncbi:MAG TPA: hypothetical protein VFT57_11575 [Gemmatimonadaceae bacterium]|nr:hypothetical protein [Gemmatimonadaceae bacterium]